MHTMSVATSHRADTARRLLDGGAIAVIRMRDTGRLLRVVEAIRRGGVTSIEITMTVPGALGLIEEAARRFADDVLLGVGSVVDPETVDRAVAAGARYVVSPVFKADVVAACHAAGVPTAPGAFTPTEIQAAYEAGAEMVKVFPADLLGPSYIKSIRAPLPHLKLVPTGGVTPANAGDWIRAGAAAVGVGSALLDKQAIAEDRFDVLTENARVMQANIAEARAGRIPT